MMQSVTQNCGCIFEACAQSEAAMNIPDGTAV